MGYISSRIPEQTISLFISFSCVVDVSRSWNYRLIIKLCCALPLPEIFECILGVYCKLFVSPTTKEMHSHKSSQVYGHLKLHFGI